MFPRLVMAVVGSVGLLLLAGFCLFGFAATFEPTSHTIKFLAFRIGYVLVGLGSLAGVVMLISNCFRIPQNQDQLR